MIMIKATVFMEGGAAPSGLGIQRRTSSKIIAQS